MTFRVVNLRVKPWPHMVYVGRPFAGLPGHPLANPFKLTQAATHEEKVACVRRYAEWLDALPDRDDQLYQLLADTEAGRLPLACWCGDWPKQPDLPCHAVVLAIALTERFHYLSDKPATA